jgi:hypothetical protein
MAPGRKTLQKVQWGKETTAGTAVAATAVWRGQASMLDDQREPQQVEEQVGIIGGTDRSYIPKLQGALALPETEATFEQLPYLLVMGLGGPTAGVADAGAGATGKIYETTIPTTGIATAKPYTVEAGDDFEVEQGEYALVTKISLSGASGQAVKAQAELMCRQVKRKASFTASLALAAVEDILFQKAKLYLDAVGGAYGTTQVSNQFLGFKLDIEIQWEPKFTGDGELYYSFASYIAHKVSGEVTFEHDTAVSRSGGEKANWENQTPRRMRIHVDGSTLATAGTAYSKKALRIDLPIKWTKFDPGDQNGNNIATGKFVSRYNSTVGDAGKIIVVNEVATLP